MKYEPVQNRVNRSRREFLKASAVLGAVHIVPASVLGANAPSNRINMGIIGTGTRGLPEMEVFIRNDDVRIMAIRDVNTASYGYRDETKLMGRQPDVLYSPLMQVGGQSILAVGEWLLGAQLCVLHTARLTARPESARPRVRMGRDLHSGRRPARWGLWASTPSAAGDNPPRRPDHSCGQGSIAAPRRREMGWTPDRTQGTRPASARIPVCRSVSCNPIVVSVLTDRHSGIAVKRASQSPLGRARRAKRWSATWPAMQTAW